MDKAVALYYMAANNYLLHLYYFSNKIRKRGKEKVEREKMEQDTEEKEKMEQENMKKEQMEREKEEKEKRYQEKGEKEKREKVKKRVKRRTWMSSIHQNRTTHYIDDIFTELTSDPEHFFNFLCMSTSDFEILLQKLAPYITKKDTSFRRAIPAKMRLAMTLRYLGSGDNYRSLHCVFKISHQIISQIVPQVCRAIVTVLKDQVKLPVNEHEWLKKEESFHDIFPNCLAAVDGRCVALSTKCRPTDKKQVALLTLVDRNYRFIYADVGSQEIISDNEFRNSSLFQALENNTLPLPTHALPHCTEHAMPYVFVADNAFPLHTNIMKPYPGDHREGSYEGIFNARLSRARAVADNAFGVMTAVFQVLQNPFSHDADRASNVVMACVSLHNFLMNSSTSNKFYMPPGYMDTISDGEIVPGSWRYYQQANGALRSLNAVTKDVTPGPMQIRDQFAEYFATRYS